MPDISEYRTYGEELERVLKLKTYPFAVKLLEKEADIPEGAIRPKRDLGCHLALCQGFSLSRRDGETVAMMKEDNWCYAPMVALGFGEPPEYYLEGNTNYPGRVTTAEAARRLAHESPKLEAGKYSVIVSAPLKKTGFEPDVAVIYCNSAQLRSLLSAIRYKDGYQVTSTLEPGGACYQSTVPVMLTGDCQVTVPCMGDRRWGLAADDEMIFAVPKSRLDDLMLGVRHFGEEALGFPIKFGMKCEYPLPGEYVKLGKMLGMEMKG